MLTIGLNGRWSAKNKNSGDTVPATVPGSIHADLLQAKKIPDPYYRDNENSLQWIGETPWGFSRTFDITPELLKHESVLLQFEGLDTLATVTLNGHKLGRTDNMFRTWEFDVHKHLIAGRNTLAVRFDSALSYIQARQKKHPIPEWCRSEESKGRGWIRKEPCNFGWDWGPVLVTCGIWRPVSLVAFNSARLTHVLVNQDHSRKGQVRLDVTVNAGRAKAGGRCHLAAVVTISRNGRVVGSDLMDLSGAALRGTVSITLKNPELWWPNGLGAQPLYDVHAELVDATGNSLDTWSRRLGLRTLRLDRHADRWGESFQFLANGVPFFAKGANWIPPDAIYSRFTPERYRRILTDTAAANMNMLRVWGGGVYAEDLFYDLCDELGICIWQDFMFACSTYPTFDAPFMANVRQEAVENVRRIRHHACLAMWCGNNELEYGLIGDKWTDKQMSWRDYDKLFGKLLGDVVKAEDPQRDYWPGSPHSTIGDRSQSNSPNSGDAHLWQVWHGRKPFEWYRTCNHRFNSEFGFQSFPEPKTTRSFTRPEDRNISSFILEHHQRSGNGNDAIMQYMLSWFRLPKDFDSILWTSQILQSLAIKYAVEHWRRAMPRGMGTTYWQLNDCWPVASWSSIDSELRWKALHYEARRFFSPILVSAVEDLPKNRMDIHLTSDRRDAVRGELRWTWIDTTGKVLEQGKKQLSIPALKTARVHRLDAANLLARQGPRNLLLWLQVNVKGEPPSVNLAHFARPKHMELLPPGLKAKVTGSSQRFALEISSQRPALWAWLELSGQDGRWSDNFFHVRPGTPLRVELETAVPMTLTDVRKQLKLRSLFDTYVTE